MRRRRGTKKRLVLIVQNLHGRYVPGARARVFLGTRSSTGGRWPGSGYLPRTRRSPGLRLGRPALGFFPTHTGELTLNALQHYRRRSSCTTTRDFGSSTRPNEPLSGSAPAWLLVFSPVSTKAGGLLRRPTRSTEGRKGATWTL